MVDERRMAALDRAKVLNFNVGVLGHIDSGKTSLGMQVQNVELENCEKSFRVLACKRYCFTIIWVLG